MDEFLANLVHKELEELDREALEAARTSELHTHVLSVATALNKQGLKTDDILDVIETEIRRQAEDLLDHEGVVARKIHVLTRFLEHDIRQVLQDTAQQAIDSRARNERAVERLGNEASLNIAQLLSQAKHELADYREPEVREALQEKIDTLDEKYSAPTVLKKLRVFLGLDFLDAIRTRLHHDILEAVSAYDRARCPVDRIGNYAEELQTKAQTHLQQANKELETKFHNEAVRKQVKSDLDDLAALYTDLDALAAKFSREEK